MAARNKDRGVCELRAIQCRGMVISWPVSRGPGGGVFGSVESVNELALSPPFALVQTAPELPRLQQVRIGIDPRAAHARSFRFSFARSMEASISTVSCSWSFPETRKMFLPCLRLHDLAKP